MLPAKIDPDYPEVVKANPNLNLATFTSPSGLPEEEVGTLQALIGYIAGGSFDGGPIIRTYWKPSKEEIKALEYGALIELDFYDTNIAPIAMNVEVI